MHLATVVFRPMPPWHPDPALAGFDPLVLPLLLGLGLGFALRRDRADLPLLAAAAVALAVPHPWVRLAGAAALLVLGLRDARRLAIAPVALGFGAVVAAALLSPDTWTTVLVQLRLLALAGAGGVVAVLGLALLAGEGAARARRAAALAALVGLYALWHDAATAWSDGWRLTSPYLIWAAPLLAAVALAGARGALVALAPIAAAVLGVVSGTALGVDGAAWALAGAGLAVGLADESARFEQPLGGLLGGLPPALPFVAAALALYAAATAVHPAPLRWAALATAALILLAGLRALGGASLGALREGWALIGALVVLGGLVVGLRPTAPAAERLAAALQRPRMPIDDMRGWRRMSRFEAAAPKAEPPDAGLP